MESATNSTVEQEQGLQEEEQQYQQWVREAVQELQVAVIQYQNGLSAALKRLRKARISPFEAREEEEDDDDEQEGEEELLKRIPFPLIRNRLKAYLTVLEFDPSPELCDKVEAILMYERRKRGVASEVDTLSLPRLNEAEVDPVASRVALWRGDITILRIGAIVNAANKYMLGCFTPNHACIDNIIHAKAGPRLREECRQFMAAQEWEDEPTGYAKITKGYCLPCAHVLHTVGPIVLDKRKGPAEGQEEELASCYTSCLDLAKQHNVRSVAFCCISTGVFGYPQEDAAIVAINAVKRWLETGDNKEHMDLVLFDTYLASDHVLYQLLLPRYFNVSESWLSANTPVVPELKQHRRPATKEEEDTTAEEDDSKQEKKEEVK
ncbi:Protein-ADP-ribose hydrolase [Balamuthia mandrillaris]